jgi:hypothetical protein
MQTLMEKFRGLIFQVTLALRQGELRPYANVPLLNYVVWHIHRTLTRFENLVKNWQAGKRPKPRQSRAGQTQSERKTERRRLPTEFGWLHLHAETPYLGQPFAEVTAQLEALLNTPEMENLLTELPQAARYLRPLRRMIGIREVPPAIGRKIKKHPPPPPPPTHARRELGGGHYEIVPIRFIENPSEQSITSA